MIRSSIRTLAGLCLLLFAAAPTLRAQRAADLPPRPSGPAQIRSVPVAPAPEAAAPTGPGGVLEVAETTFDAGKVERGAKVEHSFQIRNTGKYDLTVDARPG